MATAFLIASLAGAGLTLHAFRPLRAGRLLWPAFFAAWLTSELALHHVIWQLAVAAMFVASGALQSPLGVVAGGCCLVSWGGLFALHLVSRRASVVVGHSLRAAELHVHPGAPRYPRLHAICPWLAWTRRDVEVTRDVVFGRAGGTTLHVDIFRGRRCDGSRRPAVIQVHGGAWVIGHKRFQGVPLLGHLAANGWIGFNVDYRLSPAATFPDHLVDLKRAVAWIRQHADALGVDPGYIAVTGGSAGGHLASLLALTASDPRYQPGFEDADTSVQAAVSFYGVYDFTNRLGTKPPAFRTFLERVVMKRPFDPHGAYRLASPIDRVREDAPPFFVIHGEMDTIAPVADARLFVDTLRRRSRAAVAYAEVHGAQHAFDVFPSVRCIPVLEAVERFLHAAWAAYLHGGPTEEIETETERAIVDAPLGV